MTWLKKYIRGLRFAVLGLLLLAIIGPWTFDLINVPVKYPCSAPFVRLEGDFCGLPMSGIWILSAFILELAYRIGELIAGAAVNTEFRSLFLLIFFPLCIILPVLSTILINRHEDQPRRQVFHMAVWGAAAGVGLFFGLSSGPRLYWALWGTWLYIGLAAGALVIEVLFLAARKQSGSELNL